MKRHLCWTLRALFAFLLLTTAIGKLLDNRGFAEVMGQYQMGIPEVLLLPLALSLSLFELGLGLALVLGYRLRLMALATVAMHFVYTLLAALTTLRGIELQNCGCFGVFLARPLGWSTVIEDILLTLLALILFYALSPRPSAGAEPLGAPHASRSRA